jgi:hypothetical protein
MNDWREFLFWWLASLLAAATVVGGRLGRALFLLATDPPDDTKLAAHWARRRRWLAISELMALPSFATIAVSAVAYYKLDPIVAVLLAMFLGGIGFALLLDGAQWLFRKRLGLPPTTANASATATSPANPPAPSPTENG